MGVLRKNKRKHDREYRELLHKLTQPFYYLNRKLTSHLLRRAVNGGVTRKADGNNILYLAASCLPYHISGYTARTQALLNALSEKNAPVVALTRTGYPWDRRDRLQNASLPAHKVDKVTYHHIPHPGRLKQVAHYALSAAVEIEKFARSMEIGRIHAASNHVNALPGLIAARRMGIPFHYEMRGLWELSRASRYPDFYNSPAFQLGLELEKFAAVNADQLFTISGQLAEYAAQHWGISREKIEILPNCLTAELAEESPAANVQPNLLGYAGSLVEYEGLDVLLESLAQLRKQGMALTLRIVGDGEARERLEKLASTLGLHEQVHFLGRMAPEMAREKLRECSAVCLPRKPYEVCRIIPPFKLVESMAMGKPVLVPDLPIFHEELGELADGWTFEPGNATSLAELLKMRLTDKNSLQEQGRKLRLKALATRQWSHFIPLLLKETGKCLDH